MFYGIFLGLVSIFKSIGLVIELTFQLLAVLHREQVQSLRDDLNKAKTPEEKQDVAVEIAKHYYSP